MGRPAQAYDDKGKLVWQVEFDIYGRIRENLFNNKSFIPFRQLGQYEDVETGLYYNRFRYYDSNTGTYISQDPIKLEGNNPNFYAYVSDSNTMVDVFGLSFFRGARSGENVSFTPRPNDYKIDKETGLVKNTHGVSVFDNADSVTSKGFIANEIDMSTVPEDLVIKQRGADPKHYEIMPKDPMTEDSYKKSLSEIKCK